ncbi:nlp-36 [Pristionchus pacificus]|uniref:Nlp-36 n=1 Tax=Pristionchus pacificus TaxID=54126 RepID=A0A2A6BDW9_PRIPA|nr:nlp-36 [Pristionchus pacificus]|eukprot:PDM64063.1 nlp-36 [Pristionchus pacificus]
MSVDLHQHLSTTDYLGVVVVWAIFFSFVFLFSCTCLNWCFIKGDDDITVFEKWGAKRGSKWGPHSFELVHKRMAEQKEMKARVAAAE